MKTETLTGKIESAFGTKLPKVLEYKGTFETYESIAEVNAANDQPTAEEIVNFRNQQKRANARQKFMAEELDKAAKAWEAEGNKGTNPYVKPTLETSVDLRVKNIVDSLVAAGKSPEDATATAKALLGIS